MRSSRPYILVKAVGPLTLEDPIPTHLSKARKATECDECHEIIVKGEMYLLVDMISPYCVNCFEFDPMESVTEEEAKRINDKSFEKLWKRSRGRG